MSETKRTPGKWEAIEAPIDEVYGIKSWQFGRYEDVAYKLSENDADYICRAVNCHDRLVEYVRYLRAIAQQDYEREVSVWGKGDDSEEMEAAIGKLDALIAEAEGDGA